MATTIDLTNEHATLTNKLLAGCDTWLREAKTFAEILTQQGLTLAPLDTEIEFILRAIYISTAQMKLTSTPSGMIIETEHQLRNTYDAIHAENVTLTNERDMLRAELAALNAQHHPMEDMLPASVVEPMFQDVVKFCVLLKDEWERLKRDCESLKRECEDMKEV
ncbi:hypothetical protein N7509_009423 [Penicillium cosmopolitanum]|uniref:Uncharacterized protein n=1 Tax=Penicillium cosmopolitanum TaxID=1131564 RepID=A0A9W9VPF6_9EURO|nr:uncharacterized protein N7509_009423 [Penicillium cosmopolitanum]KAJ5386882.1 hypothetical protein N7509_009423 [Penicillium cosmopolitanum]